MSRLTNQQPTTCEDEICVTKVSSWSKSDAVGCSRCALDWDRLHPAYFTCWLSSHKFRFHRCCSSNSIELAVDCECESRDVLAFKLNCSRRLRSYWSVVLTMLHVSQTTCSVC